MKNFEDPSPNFGTPALIHVCCHFTCRAPVTANAAPTSNGPTHFVICDLQVVVMHGERKPITPPTYKHLEEKIRPIESVLSMVFRWVIPVYFQEKKREIECNRWRSKNSTKSILLSGPANNMI